MGSPGPAVFDRRASQPPGLNDLCVIHTIDLDHFGDKTEEKRSKSNSQLMLPHPSLVRGLNQ